MSYPGAPYKSQSTLALEYIDSSKYPDTNKDFEKNIQRLNEFTDYIGQYLQVMQKGVDKANEDTVQKIRSFGTEFVTLLGGGQLLSSINLGDLQYYLPAIGALFGFDATTPFPINLFNAAEKFFLGYIVPLDSFAVTINDFVGSFLETLGVDPTFIQSLKDLVNAIQSVTTDFQGFLTTLNNLLGIFGITSGTLGPFSDLWYSVTQLLGGYNISQLGSLVNPVLHNLAPWITELATLVSNFDAILQAFSGGTTNLQGIVNFSTLFTQFINFSSPTFNPLTALNTFITQALAPTTWLTDLQNLLGNPAGLGTGSVTAGNLSSIPLLAPVQSVVDLIYSGLVPGTNANNVSINVLSKTIQKLGSDVQLALRSAAEAFTATQFFGGQLHMLVAGLSSLPIYAGYQDFINQISTVVGTVWSNVLTSLSPANPPISGNIAQINAIWAHLNSSTSGINYQFASGTALTSNYPNTTNPSWTAPTGIALPVVPTAKDYVLSSSAGYSIMTFTGNPSAAVSDHGLITDRVHAGATVKEIANYGAAGVFICGRGTTTMGAHVLAKIDYSNNIVLSIFTLTGANAGSVTRASTLLSSLNLLDVLAIEYDNNGTYTAFINGMNKLSWIDSGAVISHGAGNRECGIYEFGNGAFSSDTVGLGSFVAYDY